MRRPDARKLGFNPGANPNNPVDEDRPQLPPRRAKDQRIAAAQPSIEPSGSPDRASQRQAMLGSPHNSSRQMQSTNNQASDFLPPPKRASLSKTSGMPKYQSESRPYMVDSPGESSLALEDDSLGNGEAVSAKNPVAPSDYPDASITNRRPPYCRRGPQEIDTGYDSRQVAICGRYVVTAGHLTRAWDLASQEMVLSLGHLEREIRVTSLAFKPGAKASEEGLRLWLGTNYGELQEVDILTQHIVHTKTGPHERREIVRIYRHQNSMWTLDDGGKLCVWPAGDTGLPDLQRNPSSHRVPRGHTFSIKIQGSFWLATGKDIRVFRPSASESEFSIPQNPLSHPAVGSVTSGAVIAGQLDRVYFGHTDGKVTIYSIVDYTCLGVISVSVYKINSLAGAGFYLWAGYNTGWMYVYDTRTQPWTIKKEWLAHNSPVLNIITDRSSLWKDGVLRVMSLGADNALRLWDGTLEDDWLGSHSRIICLSCKLLTFLQKMICRTMTFSIALFVRSQRLW